MSERIVQLAIVGLSLTLPTIALASGSDGSAASQPDWVVLGTQCVNFGVYLALVGYLARKPAAAYFEGRRAQIIEAVEVSQRATKEAEERLAATMAKLEAFDAERAAIFAEFREIGEADRARIISQAEVDAARLLDDAEATAVRETKLAIAGLEAKLLELALEKARAEVSTRMTATAQSQSIDNGIQALRSVAS